MATTLTDKTVSIRKQRKCFSCYRKFEAGTKMNYWAGVYEGDFGAVYSCLTCKELMDMDSENEFPEGYAREMLENGETPEMLLERYKNQSHEKP